MIDDNCDEFMCIHPALLSPIKSECACLNTQIVKKTFVVNKSIHFNFNFTFPFECRLQGEQ